MAHHDVGQRLPRSLARRLAAPDGLDGESKITHLVRDVIAFQAPRAEACSPARPWSRQSPAVPPQSATIRGRTAPIGRGNNHLVARIEAGHQRVEQDLLAAGADNAVRGLVVSRAEFLRDRRSGAMPATGPYFFGLAAPDSVDCRRLDTVSLAYRNPAPQRLMISRPAPSLSRLLRDGGGCLYTESASAMKAIFGSNGSANGSDCPEK